MTPPPVQAPTQASPLAAFAGQALARLHCASGGSADDADLLEFWVSWLWQAADDGHVCVTVDDIAARRALRASPVVQIAGPAPEITDAERDTALVLDGDRLYADRFWRAECRLAERLIACAKPAELLDATQIQTALDQLFGANSAGDGDQQRLAVERALTRRLLLLSGGPGTGKTRTIARIISLAAALSPGLRIAVAAPTGKAASRAIQALAAELGDGAASTTGLPETGMTLHRLLGVRGSGRENVHGPDNPVPFDLVLVDEASMIDLEMADALLAALAPGARLVLAGDRDQLASVEAGAVFASACDVDSGDLHDSAVVLHRNYRQQGAVEIPAFAAAIRDGMPDRLVFAPESTELQLIDTGSMEPIQVQRRIFDRLAQTLKPVWSGLCEQLQSAERPDMMQTARALLHAYGRVGVLCALRAGPLGAQHVGQAIAARVRAELGVPDERSWYVGRLVIARRNSVELGVFNGDIGVCIEVDGRLLVAFERGEQMLYVPVLQMPPCADANALTIHQSQGSEFDQVLLVPAPAGHILASRESLYTGITRARSQIVVFGTADALVWATMHPTRRDGDLLRRLES